MQRGRMIAIAAAASAALLSLVDLLLADRKFGLFSGGFGQSRAVDSPIELLLFFAGYVAIQTLIGIAAWAVIARLNPRRPGWPRLAHFLFGFGGGFCFLLASQYQLYSYFSDTMSFALMKQLGGGSLGDALLFSINEIALGGGALFVAVSAYWFGWRWLRRRFPQAEASELPSRRSLWLAALASLVALALIPASGSDAAFGLNRSLAWKAATSALDVATDVDRDGYGLVGISRDSHPFDSARHPLALDRPGNGVDEDGLGGDLVLEPVAAPVATPKLPGPAPNLVVVVMESTRGDVIGKRIGGKPVAPHLEALAKEGGVVVPSFSHVAFTTASLKSIFSGQLAPKAGAPSLFRDLSANGYRIGVLSGQPEDFGDISATVAMRENADVYVDAETLRDKRAFGFAAQGSLLIDEKFLMQAFDTYFGKGRDWDKPVFLYTNFQSPHFPYHHDGMPQRLTDRPIPRDQISAANRAWVEATYWNAVAASDQWLGELIDRLKRLGVWDNTILIVTGDHGEDLFEGGFLGHGHIINRRQFSTFLATNRPRILPRGPIGLSDYRAIMLAALAGSPVTQPAAKPFLHIGPLDTPTQIGLSDGTGALATLRLDTREACFPDAGRCAPYDKLAPADRARIDAVIRRWGSERWAARGR